MTHRELPPRPDIDGLRREAKRLCRRLRRQAPEAKLADAQFILAAEYGFKSWGRLKSEIDRRNEARWAARLAAQENFNPPAYARSVSLQHVWLMRQQQLAEGDDLSLISPETAWLHIGFILLALLTALGMALR